MNRRLILWDIDGTLLSSNGAAPRAFLAALLEVFGTNGSTRGVSFGGKTDPQIARELLRADGVSEEKIRGGLPILWEAYLPRLRREIAEVQATVYPGVHPLLDALETGAGVTMGLLTGNIREAAQIKLGAAGIGWERFKVGAFGSDHADRPELPAIAVRRALERTGYGFRGKEIVIIGDTPADIACGERLGVRTIAVATGSYTEEQLAECGPDHLFATLEDLDAVRGAILAP